MDGRLARLPPIAATVLARLLLARGGSVDAEQLYRDAWPGPEVAVKRDQRVAVHKRIAELRSIFDPDSPAQARALLLTERSARTCYRLAPDADQVDLYRFDDLVSWADATDNVTAIDLLAQALALWTQRPLGGLPDRPFVRAAVARLVARRDRACRELMVRCRTLGRWREGLAVLDRLLAAQPDDADLHRLIEQLRREGVEPADRPTATITLPPLWNVPLRMTDLVPRPGLIARVREQLAGGPVALVGIPGVGKSRVAIEYAHQLAPCYRVTWWLDAQRADRIGDQLRELATQAGLVGPASDVPTAVAAVKRFLRTMPPGNALLIYDNAVDAEQVRPWLPDSGQVLITSRSPGWAETAT
ncbi:MAG: hypothetical protein L0Y54_22590, partial [Sporichthyaceae bacterium]|nr:hypothetical protein [Sporichthyaceae bacterium]